MTQTIEMRRWSFAIAGLAALLWSGGAMAQAAQSTLRANGKMQPAAAQDSSGADAEAYAKLNGGQVNDAAVAFQAILVAQPKDVGALTGMGRVRMLQGNYLGAVSFLEQAKQASPNDAAIASALDGARYRFLMGEGRDALTAKDMADAEKRYREALGLRPDETEVVSALANVLVLENRLSDAQQVLLAAVAHTAVVSGRAPAELAMQLAQLDIANNQPQAAYTVFLQVLDGSPQRVDAWSGLISALHLMGHDGDAMAQEKVIPAETRVQLEATPGFQQMMNAMVGTPAQPASGESAYAPFVPSVHPVAAQPVPAATPIISATTSVPAIHNPPRTASGPQHSQTPVANAPAKSSVTRPVNAVPAPKVVASSQPAKAPATQAVMASHPSNSSASAAPLVTQPAARPATRIEEIPDTGEQQYPQPKTRPRVAQ